MAVTTYTVIEGEVVSQVTGGVRLDYMPDPLGSTLALLDNAQNMTDTFEYWPYGEVRARTGATNTPFQFVGTLGYYKDTGFRTYVRARYYKQILGTWMTVDPLWPNELAYTYAAANATTLLDPSGFNCTECAYLMGVKYFNDQVHWCHHEFIHCVICCVLSSTYGPECAEDMQNRQFGTPEAKKNRLAACRIGIGFGRSRFDIPTCRDKCAKHFPGGGSKDPNCKDPHVPIPKEIWVPFPECYNLDPYYSPAITKCPVPRK